MRGDLGTGSTRNTSMMRCRCKTLCRGTKRVLNPLDPNWLEFAFRSLSRLGTGTRFRPPLLRAASVQQPEHHASCPDMFPLLFAECPCQWLLRRLTSGLRPQKSMLRAWCSGAGEAMPSTGDEDACLFGEKCCGMPGWGLQRRHIQGLGAGCLFHGP